MRRVRIAGQTGHWRRRSFVGAAVSAVLAGPLAGCGGGGGGSGSDSSEQATAAGIGRWTVAGEILAARRDPQALVLRDGRVLVLGGGVQTQEIFDPATNRASLAGTWARSWEGFTATLLPDGRVLVLGGFEYDPAASGGRAYTTTTLLFDPATIAWSERASLPDARAGQTMALLPDGRLLVLGGWTGFGQFAPNAFYDVSSDTWSAAPEMAKPRASHTATLLQDGRVLVVGGHDSGDGGTSSQLRATDRVELFDPGTDTWSLAATFPAIGRFAHTATLLRDGRVLVAGGSPEEDPPYQYLDAAYTYAPATDSWKPAGRMETGRFEHCATLLADGRVLIGGGNTWANGPALPEIYDPSIGTWEPTTPMVNPRVNFTIVAVPDGRGLALGGGTSVEAWK